MRWISQKNLPEGYFNEDLEDAENSGALDVRAFFLLSTELKEHFVALSANGSLPYSMVPLMEDFQTLLKSIKW